ncbi:MAG: hypothetical protein AB7G11_15070 [Phycisphaerales bacterium]
MKLPSPASPAEPEATAADRNLRWPAERFYWSVVTMPRSWRVSPRAPLSSGLQVELALEVPVDADQHDLHGVALSVGLPSTDPARPGSVVLICALPRASLARLDDTLLSLCPSDVPAPVLTEVARLTGALAGDAALEINADRLNLLVGEFEPRPRRRARFVRHARWAAALLLIAALVAGGLQRRALHERAVAAHAAQARLALVSRIGGTEEEGGHRSAPLAASILQLRALVDAAEKSPPSPDAALSLTTLLAAWPGDPESAVPLSVRVVPERIAASVRIDSGDPTQWLGLFITPPGWSLIPPSLSTQGTSSFATLELTAAPPVPGSSTLPVPTSQSRPLPESGEQTEAVR